MKLADDQAATEQANGEPTLTKLQALAAVKAVTDLRTGRRLGRTVRIVHRDAQGVIRRVGAGAPGT